MKITPIIFGLGIMALLLIAGCSGQLEPAAPQVAGEEAAVPENPEPAAQETETNGQATATVNVEETVPAEEPAAEPTPATAPEVETGFEVRGSTTKQLCTYQPSLVCRLSNITAEVIATSPVASQLGKTKWTFSNSDIIKRTESMDGRYSMKLDPGNYSLFMKSGEDWQCTTANKGAACLVEVKDKGIEFNMRISESIY